MKYFIKFDEYYVIGMLWKRDFNRRVTKPYLSLQYSLNRTLKQIGNGQGYEKSNIGLARLIEHYYAKE